MLISVDVQPPEGPLVMTISSTSEEKGVIGLRLLRSELPCDDSITDTSELAKDCPRSLPKLPEEDDS